MSFVRGARLMLAFFAFILLQQMCDAQEFRSSPLNPTTVVQGENSSSVSLRWEYDLKGKTLASVTFKRIRTVNGQGEAIYRKPEGQSPTIMDAYKGRVDLIQEAGAVTLKIKNVREDEDEAFFECQIVTGGDSLPYTSKRIKLRVLHIPKITKFDLRKTATLNKNVTLSCNASGDPDPKIQWVKVGDERKNSSSGYLIHLTNFKLEDIGAYRCIADNGLDKTANATTIVEVNCNSDECQIVENIVITIKLPWDSALTNSESDGYKRLESYLLGEIWKLYSQSVEGRNKKLRKVSLAENLREGSVIATLQMEFAKSASDPLKPLRDAVNGGKVGAIPVERKMLIMSTTASTTSESTESTVEPPDSGKRTSGLSEEAKWGIIGACIAVALIVIIVLIICCCCRQKKKQPKGSQYETDSSYMSTKRSGLGGASPAYAQASAYRQPPYNPNTREPARDGTLTYSQVSYTNSQPPQNTSPPPYDNSMSGQEHPEKGKEGFELWC